MSNDLTIPKTSADIVACTSNMEAGLNRLNRSIDEGFRLLTELAGVGDDGDILKMLRVLGDLSREQKRLFHQVGCLTIAHRDRLKADAEPTSETP